METITITLNGREVSGNAGMTVLEVARESGVDIPTLCHAPHLKPAGACRICLVEDERTGALLASCVTPIASGMVINTASPRVLERRKTIVELVLASHPDSCLVCDKGNRCQLRQIASEIGVGLVSLQKIPLQASIEEVNPFIERDLSKCILCAKCIRADHELVVEGAIDYISRGFSSKPATLNDLPLERSECTFCGTCVSICPTGALMEKERPYRGTTATTVTTICPLCGCGCSVSLEVKGNRIVRARPDNDSPVNRGTLCARGSYGYDFVHSPERLAVPLVRINGQLREASWEEALDMAAAGFLRIKNADGANSLAVLSSSKCTNEENYLLQRFARSVLGTNNIDNGSRLYGSASHAGLGWTLGTPGTTSYLSQIERSQVILVIGANPTSSAPAVGYAIKRAVAYQGAQLLLVDPRRIKLASFAHLWLRPKIGTDIALVNGLAHLIVAEGLSDEEHVAACTDNFEALTEALAKYTPEYVQEITGVPMEYLAQAARLFARAKQASIVYGNGITQQVAGTDSVMALANLAMLTGNTGFRGGGIYALQRDANGQGACDVGALPDFLPGYQSLEDASARKRFSARWRVDLPRDPGLTAVEMIEHASQGDIKGMYVVGENPTLSFPNLAQVKRSLASLEHLVVQDLFLTETAKLAHVVLPAASFAEKEGTFTNFEGRVQRLRRVIEPYASSLPDWQIVLRLAERMGCPLPYSSVREVMEEMDEMVPLYQGRGYAEDMKEVYRTDLSEHPRGTRRLHGPQFPSGFDRFYPVEYTPEGKSGEDGFPLTLLTGSTMYHWGTGSRSSRSLRMKKFQPDTFVEVSRSDFERLGVSQGEQVKISTRTGEIVAPIRVGDDLPPGLIFLPVCFPTSPIGELFCTVLDPRVKTPALKTCAARLQRIGADG